MRGIMRIYLRRFDIALVIFRGFCSLYFNPLIPGGDKKVTQT